MNISRNWNDYEAFVFIFLIRWNFYPAANEFRYTLNFVKCKTSKIQKKKLLPCCWTWWTFMDFWKRKARPDEWMSQCLLVVYPNLPWIPATQPTLYRNYRSTTSYWIAARNNWNRTTNVILKFSRACAGHCLVYIICINTCNHVTTNDDILINLYIHTEDKYMYSQSVGEVLVGKSPRIALFLKKQWTLASCGASDSFNFTQIMKKGLLPTKQLLN